MKKILFILISCAGIIFILSFTWKDEPLRKKTASSKGNLSVMSSKKVDWNNIVAWYSNDGIFSRNPSSGKSAGDGASLITISDSNENEEFDNLFSTGTYKFQGYNIHQVKNYSYFPSTADTVRIKTYDITDGAGNIYDSTYLKEYNSEAFALVQKADNKGISRTRGIERDTFTSKPFNERYEYKFAVSAYYYDPQGGLKTLHKVMHSNKVIISFVAQPSAIETVSHYSYGDLTPTDQNDPGVVPLITDPLRLLTANYVSIIYSDKKSVNNLFWNLVGFDSGIRDTLLIDKRFYSDSAITGIAQEF